MCIRDSDKTQINRRWYNCCASVALHTASTSENQEEFVHPKNNETILTYPNPQLPPPSPTEIQRLLKVKELVQSKFKQIRRKMDKHCTKMGLEPILNRTVLHKNVWHSEKFQFDYCGTPKGNLFRMEKSNKAIIVHTIHKQTCQKGVVTWYTFCTIFTSSSVLVLSIILYACQTKSTIIS